MLKQILDYPLRALHEIGELPNTFWGLLILFISMYITIHSNVQIGYYFAGIGTTLIGINRTQAASASYTGNPPKLEVTTDASNSSSQS